MNYETDAATARRQIAEDRETAWREAVERRVADLEILDARTLMAADTTGTIEQALYQMAERALTREAYEQAIDAARGRVHG